MKIFKVTKEMEKRRQRMDAALNAGKDSLFKLVNEGEISFNELFEMLRVLKKLTTPGSPRAILLENAFGARSTWLKYEKEHPVKV